MKAISIVPHTRQISLRDYPEPQLTSPTQVKVRILEVGICGTDREEVAGGRADAPQGEKELIIGHEMLGEVSEVGSSAQPFKAGDLVVITVRRPCPDCPLCKQGMFDFCLTGNYKERGIKELHGFQAEFAIEESRYLVPVPPALRKIAVLTEPTTVVEKAIDHACRIQAQRLAFQGSSDAWLKGKKALVAGLGPIGLLAAMVLALRGAQVFGLDRSDPNSLRPRLLKQLGGTHVSGSLDKLPSDFDLIVDAAGAASLDFATLEHLAINGIYALTGVPGDGPKISIDGAGLMRQLVLKNQVLFGSVNAGHEHFQKAVADLEAAQKRWPNLIESFITSRIAPQDCQTAFQGKKPDEIKAVVQWSK